jgi:hypothetical protein
MPDADQRVITAYQRNTQKKNKNSFTKSSFVFFFFFFLVSQRFIYDTKIEKV